MILIRLINRRLMGLILAASLLTGGCQSLAAPGGGAVGREEFDNLSRRVDNLEDIVVDRRTGLLPGPAAIGPQGQALGSATGSPAVGSATMPPPAVQTAPPVSGSDHSLYQRGQALLKQKKFDQAAAVFSQMLAQNPGGRLAPNARYWLGECHYAQGRFREAALEFERCAADYPQSAKAPDALLKLSYSYDRLGDGPRAMVALDNLLNRYPSSNAAAMIKSGRGRFTWGRFRPFASC